MKDIHEKTVSLTVTIEMHEKLNKLSWQLGVSKSFLIRRALERYFVNPQLGKE